MEKIEIQNEDFYQEISLANEGLLSEIAIWIRAMDSHCAKQCNKMHVIRFGGTLLVRLEANYRGTHSNKLLFFLFVNCTCENVNKKNQGKLF